MNYAAPQTGDAVASVGDKAFLVIADTVPLFRRRLAECCANLGVPVLECSTLADVSGSDAVAIVLVVRHERDWEALADTCERWPHIPVVAVLQRLISPVARRAIALGAHGVAEMNAAPERIVTTVRSALDGFTILPRDLAIEIARSDSHHKVLTAPMIGWLHSLAEGVTVSHLAGLAGYSEREMHRHLSRLYSELDADNRTDALLKAQRLGLID